MGDVPTRSKNNRNNNKSRGETKSTQTHQSKYSSGNRKGGQRTNPGRNPGFVSSIAGVSQKKTALNKNKERIKPSSDNRIKSSHSFQPNFGAPRGATNPREHETDTTKSRVNTNYGVKLDDSIRNTVVPSSIPKTVFPEQS